jgi:hypothetical protein
LAELSDSRWQSGNCPETGLEEISGDLLEADFKPGIVSGSPVVTYFDNRDLPFTGTISSGGP